MAEEKLTDISVDVGPIRVLITHSDGCWFAQGLEVDYAAAGTSEKDVQERFACGLWHTFNEHFLLFGDLDNLDPAPAEWWKHLLKSKKVDAKKFAAEWRFKIPDSRDESRCNPFSGLDYYKPQSLDECPAI